MCCFFLFKQKTAYEMRISDWSSDVCSSDLAHEVEQTQAAGLITDPQDPLVPAQQRGRDSSHACPRGRIPPALLSGNSPLEKPQTKGRSLTVRVVARSAEIGRASCRERVWQYV